MLSWFRKKGPMEDDGELAKVLGFADVRDFRLAVALGTRAGVVNREFRHHYQFLCDCYGSEAARSAGEMLIRGTFDARFPGQSLDQALSQLAVDTD